MDGVISPTWNVAIICNKNNFSLPLVCSGSLLNDQWVLASASCVCNTNNKNDLVVRSGKVHTCSVSERKESEYSIEEVYCYSDFRRTNLVFDLALVNISTTNVSKELHGVRPVCIKHGRGRNQILPNDKMIYYGWGNIASATPHIALLKMSISMVVNNRKCRSSFPKEDNTNVKGSLFCTMTNVSDACAGNVGSGVVSIVGHKRLFLQGVISKSINDCGQPGSFVAGSKVQSKKF